MKVVMVGPYPEPGRAISGGVERVIDTLLPELAREVNLTLVVPGAASDAEARNHGVRTIYLRRGPGPGVMSYWTADAWRLSDAVDAEQPDLVHLQAVAGVGRGVSLPRIITVHGIAHRDLIYSTRGQRWGVLVRHGAACLMRLVERRARHQIANTIVINPYVTEALPDVQCLRQFHIPNPIDPHFCQSLQGPATARSSRLISVGRIGPLKNTATIVHIANLVLQDDPRASLAICGAPTDQEYFRACVEVADMAGNRTRVEWLGNLGTQQLLDQLDQASVLLMASRQENAPVAIAEAHARGVAVVAPQAFGIKYMIRPGENGFFLPDGSIKEQAHVVRVALDHSWNREAIAAEARATYAPHRIAAQTVAAYREVLASHGRSAGRC